MNMKNPICEFRDAMLEAGVSPPSVVADGKIHRFYVEGDKNGSRNGYYVLHLNGRAAGIFGSWKTGMQSTWVADKKRIDYSEREALMRMHEESKNKSYLDRRRNHEACAIKAREEWSTASEANVDHPYVVGKAVKPYGLRQSAEHLLVPLYDSFGILWNLQRISSDGQKRFRSGRAAGLFCPIGDLRKTGTILICEGWATGATLHHETAHLVFCAMTAGNLMHVTKAARVAWPLADLVICADNDRNTPGNPGLAAANAAATATGAKIIVPKFSDNEIGSDFNDLAVIRRGGC